MLLLEPMDEFLVFIAILDEKGRISDGVDRGTKCTYAKEKGETSLAIMKGKSLS